MKALLLGAGRRVSLAQRFIALGFDIYSYETEYRCPIANYATIIEGKIWNDQDIRNHILETIKDIQPDLILPLNDFATSILSSISHSGIITASGRTNTICLDKRKFANFLQDHKCYPHVQLNQPVIVKPIFGANSKGVKIISYYDYLNNNYQETHVAQRFINGFEVSVDAYFNKYSQMIDAVPRKRVEVQGGEVCRSTTLPREFLELTDITKNIGEKMGLVGPVCAQFIVENDIPFIMEINARFGGGVILSMEAGFDQIQLLIDEYIYNQALLPTLSNYKVNFSMTRYFQEYFYGENDE